MEQNKYLDGFLEEATSNVVDPVTFAVHRIVQKVIDSNKVEDCYGEEIVKATASAPKDTVWAVTSKFSAHFGSRDFKVTRFKDLVKAARPIVCLEHSDLIVGENGNVRPLLANAITELLNSPIKLLFDEFACNVQIEGMSPWGTEGLWTDRDNIACTDYLQHKGVCVQTGTTHEAAIHIAHLNHFHPVRDYLAGLKWDGTPRVEGWLNRYLGVPVMEDNRYLTGAGEAWLMSLVARVMTPGCKADHVLVLEGITTTIQVCVENVDNDELRSLLLDQPPKGVQRVRPRYRKVADFPASQRKPVHQVNAPQYRPCRL